MEWAFYVATIFLLIDIEEKIRKLNRNSEENLIFKSKKNIAIKDYLNKSVNIILKDNSELTDAYLFSATSKTIGKIIDYDYEWIIFKYYNKTKKKNILQYIKILDIESIDELN